MCENNFSKKLIIRSDKKQKQQQKKGAKGRDKKKANYFFISLRVLVCSDTGSRVTADHCLIVLCVTLKLFISHFQWSVNFLHL